MTENAHNNTEPLLPIGSVVLLKNDRAPLMIYGRMMLKKGDTQAWDYVSVPYPEGVLKVGTSFFFNKDQVETVLFVGYLTAEELMFREWLEKTALGEDAGKWPPEEIIRHHQS